MEPSRFNLRHGFEAFRDFVNPLIALRTELSGEPVRVLTTARGQLVTEDGAEIEDFHGTQAFGHRNPFISRAVVEYLQSDVPSWFPSRVNPFAGELARRLCTRATAAGGGLYDNAYFASSGSEAVEAGIKLARAVTRRPRVLSLERAYHGCTMGSCGLMAKGVFRDPFGPHLPGFDSLPFGDIAALEEALAREDVAAVVVEPIQLEGGVHVLPADYVTALGTLTARHGALLVADEVQTGLGRTGRFFASEAWPRRPDVVLLGKHLGGGLLPMSAMLTRRELFERAYGKNFETSETTPRWARGSASACARRSVAHPSFGKFEGKASWRASRSPRQTIRGCPSSTSAWATSLGIRQPGCSSVTDSTSVGSSASCAATTGASFVFSPASRSKRRGWRSSRPS
jgi:acetylornithine/succinyldiaminopimelate/putrescine aminotransferase